MTLFFKLRKLLYSHFQEHFAIYLILTIFFMVGIFSGAITIKVLNQEQKKQIIDFLDSFFKILKEEPIDNIVIFKQSLVNNFKTVIMIWLLGVTVIGAPIIIVILIVRGFVIGFTVGFLIKELAFDGFIFTLTTIFPQNIFIIPGILIISVISICFSVETVKRRRKKMIQTSFVKEFVNYTVIVLLISLIIILGSAVEAFVTPVFINLVNEYI